MKKRVDFVSNSSSSSFICAIPKGTDVSEWLRKVVSDMCEATEEKSKWKDDKGAKEWNKEAIQLISDTELMFNNHIGCLPNGFFNHSGNKKMIEKMIQNVKRKISYVEDYRRREQEVGHDHYLNSLKVDLEELENKVMNKFDDVDFVKVSFTYDGDGMGDEDEIYCPEYHGGAVTRNSEFWFDLDNV